MRVKRRGTILIVVMIAIAALAGMVLALGRTVRVEAMATANHVASARATAAEHAAEQYVIWALCRDRESAMTLDESYFSAIPVGNDAVFWIVRPDYNDTNMPRYGLVDEASKLNFGQATRDMLRAIPIMPDPLPDSIFDWKDADSTVEDDGAEDEYYLAQPQPYRAKNDAFEAVEELLLVRGAYPELLYGDGTRNSLGQQVAPNGDVVSGGMQVGAMSDQEWRARGLFNYITCYSREPRPATGGNAPRQGRINVNTASREVLACLPGLSASDADSLISKRGQSGFGQTDVSWVTTTLGQKATPDLLTWVTGQSYQFSADIVAASTDGRAFRRVRIVVDAQSTSDNPKIIFRHDITDGGWPLEQGILDSMKQGSFQQQRSRGGTRSR
jgi:type II secretory pathway component PulK